MWISSPKDNSLWNEICEVKVLLSPVTDEIEITAYRTVMALWGSKEETWQNSEVI